MSLSRWTVLDTGRATARQNMELDAKLLNEIDPRSLSPILHLYDWTSPSVTYGHFIDPACYFAAESGVNLAKRPTGGGIIFHTTDWAFSILVPAAHPAYSLNIMENYAFVNRLVIDLIAKWMGRIGHRDAVQMTLLPQETTACSKPVSCFCMAKPTRYDVMLDGKKVGGGAQRRTKAGFLHQGSISLAPPDERLLERVLLPKIGVSKAMLENTYALLLVTPSQADLQEARCALAALFPSILKEQERGI